jgi:hypothetical protein
MTWQQIRERYPDQWVLMESLQSHDEGDQRIYDSLAVLDSCEDNGELFPRYRRLKARHPEKEIIFYHAANEQMDIRILPTPGMRKWV